VGRSVRNAARKEKVGQGCGADRRRRQSGKEGEEQSERARRWGFGKSIGFGVRARTAFCQVCCPASCGNICILVGVFPNGAASLLDFSLIH
jgi:hypothetical protein